MPRLARRALITCNACKTATEKEPAMYKKIPTVSQRFNPVKAFSVGVLLLTMAATYALGVSF